MAKKKKKKAWRYQPGLRHVQFLNPKFIRDLQLFKDLWKPSTLKYDTYLTFGKNRRERPQINASHEFI